MLRMNKMFIKTKGKKPNPRMELTIQIILTRVRNYKKIYMFPLNDNYVRYVIIYLFYVYI